MALDRMLSSYPGGTVEVAVDTDPGWGSRPDLWPSLGEHPCYDAFLYHGMTNDQPRVDMFRRALRPLVAGRHVLDIGTGRDLNWALEAARNGARRVTAVESITDSYTHAAATLAQQPVATPIELVCATSSDLNLAERAEVCVAELIGTIASSEGMLAVIKDAFRRLLVPGAAVVPAACDTVAGAVCLRSWFPGGLAFAYDAVPYIEQIFGHYGRPFDLRLAVSHPPRDCLISDTAVIERLTFDGKCDLDGTTASQLTMQRTGAVDGLLCWIRLHTGDGLPPVDSLLYHSSWLPAYLPLFDDPVHVNADDVLAFEFRRSTSDDGVHPDYEVQARLRTAAGHMLGSHTSGHHSPRLGSSAAHRELLNVPGPGSAGRLPQLKRMPQYHADGEQSRGGCA